MHMVETMLDAMNDRAGTEEEQGLEEGVCDQVEQAGRIGADTQGSNHEAKLGYRRVGQHTLDIPLRQADQRRETAP